MCCSLKRIPSYKKPLDHICPTLRVLVIRNSTMGLVENVFLHTDRVSPGYCFVITENKVVKSECSWHFAELDVACKVAQLFGCYV